MLSLEPIAPKTRQAGVLTSNSLSLLEKSISTSKNPSKPPVVSMPPKAPEDKASNTHFGVVIHDRGRCADRASYLLNGEPVVDAGRRTSERSHALRALQSSLCC